MWLSHGVMFLEGKEIRFKVPSDTFICIVNCNARKLMFFLIKPELTRGWMGGPAGRQPQRQIDRQTNVGVGFMLATFILPQRLIGIAFTSKLTRGTVYN